MKTNPTEANEGNKVPKAVPEQGQAAIHSGIITQNAIIESASFCLERGLTIWVQLDYGGSGQGFGGYLLYAPKDWTAHTEPGNYCGHFIYRLFQVAEVSDWNKLRGRSVRVRGTYCSVEEIGHIIHEDWFNPKKEFEDLRAAAEAREKRRS
jgi:hypothetical protein